MRGQRRLGRGLAARLFPCEEGAGAAAADRDLVGDQVDPVAVAQRARAVEIGRVMHRHAGGALRQRLDDQRGDLAGALAQQRFQLRQRARGHVGGRFAAHGLARIRRHHHMGAADQRVVGIAEDLHVGHRERAHGLAVVAVAQAARR
ncbi:hypothetical protein D9M70_455460 [compost metagenome]